MNKESNAEPPVDLEPAQRQRMTEINSQPGERARLEVKYGRVWNTQELTLEFEIKGFRSPWAVVKCKADGKLGSVEFQHHPRYYFNFVPDNPPTAA